MKTVAGQTAESHEHAASNQLRMVRGKAAPSSSITSSPIGGIGDGALHGGRLTIVGCRVENN